MTGTTFIGFLGDLVVFAGNSLSLFLISLHRYSLRVTKSIWVGLFLVSSVFSVFACLRFPSGGPMLGQAVSLGLCAPVFLLTSQGNFLKNLFLFTSYINVFLYFIAISQTLAASFMDNHPLAVLEFRAMFLSIFCIVLVYDIRPAFRRAEQSLPRGWGTLTVLVCIFSGCLLVMAYLTNLFQTVDTQTMVVLAVLCVIMASSYIVIFKTIGARARKTGSASWSWKTNSWPASSAATSRWSGKAANTGTISATITG